MAEEFVRTPTRAAGGVTEEEKIKMAIVAQKWIAIEQALSGSISMVAQEIAQLAPATPVDAVSAKVAIFTKAVNDAFVTLCNDLGIFPHS